MILNKNSLVSFFNLKVVQISLLFMLVILLYFPSTESLWSLWIESDTTDYSHGILLFILSFYIFYTRLRYFKITDNKPVSKKLLVFIVALSLFWAVFVLTGIKVAHQFIYVALLYLVVWVYFGPYGRKFLATPLLLVMFAIPVWNIINQGHLQLFTAYLVTNLLNLTGVSAVREGVEILIVNGTFRVAENCSGMRQLVAAMPIAAIFAAMYRLKPVWSIGLFVLAVFTASLSNIIRIYIVVVSGYLTDMQHYFVTQDHVTLGWVVFAVIFSLFMFLASKYYMRVAAKQQSDLPIEKEPTYKQNSGSFALLVPVLIVIVTGPAFYLYRTIEQSTSPSVIMFPDAVDGWQAEISNDKLGLGSSLLPGDVQYKAIYTRDDSSVYMAINYFYAQQEYREAVSSSNLIYDRHVWKLISQENIKVKSESDLSIAATEIILKNSDTNRTVLVWSWYLIQGNEINSYLFAKLNNMWGVVVGEPEAGLIIMAIEYDGDEVLARKILREFVMMNYVPVKSSLVTSASEEK